MGSFLGSVTGTLTGMESWSLESIGIEAVTTQDVYIPDDVPWVAQITLNWHNNADGCAAWVFEVNGTDYFMNCVYGRGTALLTFALTCGFPLTDGFGGTVSEALANVFLFSGNSTVVPTPAPVQYYGGGDYDR